MDYCKKCKVQTKSIEINELFKPARKNYETRHVKQTGIDETWQADLYCFYRPKKNTDDPSFKIQTRNNLKSKQTISVKDNHKTLLKANKAAIPLKTKKGLEIANVFLNIFEERIMLNQKLPKNLHVDEGDKIKKIIYQNKSWVDELPKIIKTYNNTYHRTIKMKPSEVNISNENELLSTVYNYNITKSKPKFEINDRVRLSSFTDVYRNKLKTKWTKEIFTIIKVIKSNVNYYKLKDIDGCIYEEELQISLL
ncbi:hypothetical protein AGLY_002099 [Aphis glycines]|uniref:Integrase catalytic domain-containing protein n=1 Tax=Aphis glycines TaxID=307491 RepID=A0A6G0U437_APHGL|nr:hypothetical protein AGLY_002099 [Aphis glycines]